MRTLRRNTATGLYVQGPDRWTSTPADAHDFRMIDRALDFIETWRLRDMELAFGFRNSRPVTGVPLAKIALRFSER